MVWYQELGFSSNPFSIKPGAFHNKIIGYDLSEIFEKIEKGQIVFIEGRYGYGKTTVIKHIIRRFGGKGQIAYYSCNRADRSINVEAVLKGKYGLAGRLFGLMPRDMILLLDEVETLEDKDQEDLLHYFDDGNIKSIVFFGQSFEKAGFSVGLKKHLASSVIQLTPLAEKEAIELVRERIGDVRILSDKIIAEVFKHSGYNPRLLLENLEDLCRYAIENNEEEVTDEHLQEVLKVKRALPRKRKKRSRASRQASKAAGAGSAPEEEEAPEPDTEDEESDEVESEEEEKKKEPEYFY